MALAQLSAFDRRVIFECLTASAKGPFFRDADLAILFGLTRQDLLDIVARLPRIDDREPEVRRAIGHALLDLVFYPHGRTADWSDWISVSPATVDEVGERWRAQQPPLEYDFLDLHGPAFLAGRYYRVVVYSVRGGGRGMGCEVWSGGKWVFPCAGPGCNEVLAAPPATAEELARAGVDCSPLPSGYDPLAVSSEPSPCD